MKTEKKSVRAKEKPVGYKKKEINLLAALEFADYERTHAKKGSSNGFLAVLAALVVIAAAGGYFLLYMHRQELADENNRLELELNSSLTLGQVYKAEQLRLKNKYLLDLEKAAAIQLMPLENASSQFLFYEADLFEKIREQFDEKIRLNKIVIDGAELKLTLVAERPAEAALFVKRLRDIGQFADITYSGFSADGAVTDNEAAVEFVISCRFTEKQQTAERGEG